MPHRNAASSWDVRIGGVLLQLAGVLEPLTEEQWEAPSLCEGWRIRDVAGHLLVRVGCSGADAVKLAGRVWAQDRRRGPMAVFDAMSRDAAEASYVELVAELRRIATQRSVGKGRTGLSELIECVVHGYDIANPLDIDLAVAPEVTRAIAERTAKLPFGRPARLLKERTLVATDAHWRVGTGPELPGTAEELILYLFGRHPARSSPATSAEL